MNKFKGKYNVIQTIEIKDFISKDSTFRFGLYNDTPAVLIGFENVFDVPDEFIRINLSDMKEEHFELYFSNKLDYDAKELEYRLERVRDKLPSELFEKVRIKRIDKILKREKASSEVFERVINDDGVFVLYTLPIFDEEDIKILSRKRG